MKQTRNPIILRRIALVVAEEELEIAVLAQEEEGETLRTRQTRVHHLEKVRRLRLEEEEGDLMDVDLLEVRELQELELDEVVKKRHRGKKEVAILVNRVRTSPTSTNS